MVFCVTYNRLGRITRIEVYYRETPYQVHSYLNGDLPTRYKPSFSTSFRREERITDFWKTPILKLVLTYCPPHQVSVLSVAPGWHAHNLSVDFYRPEDNIFDQAMAMGADRFETRLMMANGARFGADLRHVLELVAATSEEFNSPDWELVASAVFEEKTRSVDADLKSVELSGLLLPADVYVFYVTDCQATVHGFCSENDE